MQTDHDISPDEALLVEYLDGELSVQGRRTVEERLGREPELRETLARLEENWRLLDLLEREETDKTLVETTMTVLALEMPAGGKRPNLRWRPLIGSALFLSLLLLFGLAFLAGSRAGDKYAVLRTATPIIERLDLYLPFLEEDDDLLRLLTERRVFLPSQSSDHSTVELWQERFSVPELEQQIRRIENFDEALYSRFYDNYQKFTTLSKERRRRLMDFHDAIVQSPNRYELLLTLQNYHNWRKSLQSYEKAELRRPMSAANRVEQIVELKNRLDANHAGGDVDPRISVAEASEGERLARTLGTLPMAEKERLLGESPERILRILDERTSEP